MRWLAACAALLATPVDAAESLQRQMLDVHNRERAAVGVGPLTWSPRLARGAQAWADRLARTGDMEHAPPARRAGQGENLAWGSPGLLTPAAAAQLWADEKADFRRGRYPDVVARDREAQVGHYTQMVWRTTTELGCATARSRGVDVFVCRYAPPGNVVGREVY